MKKINVILIIVSLSSFLFLANIGAIDLPDRFSSKIENDQLNVEAPIYIDGDTNFTATATARSWPGSGTEGSPYLLDSMEIQGDGSNTLITILNTNVHFVISNSFLNNSFTAIDISFVNNGTFRDNVIAHSQNGIILTTSTYMHIIQNTIHDISNIGVYFNRADNNNFVGNILFNNYESLFLERADYNIISSNQISTSWTGILAVLSSRNLITQNMVFDNNDGIYLTDPFLTNVTQNTVSGNNLGIFATDSQENRFTENIAYENTDGMLIDRQDASFVSDNLAFNNTDTGITVSFGNGVSIHDNEAFQNGKGMRLYFGVDHQVFNNSIHNNAIGMDLDSVENYQITDHNLVNNGFVITYYLNNFIYHKLRSLQGNTVNGLPVKYLNHTVGETITGTWGQVLLVNSSFTDISNVEVTNSSVGIFLSGSKNNTISNVILTGNDAGVGLYANSDGNQVYNSLIIQGDKGVDISDSTENTINATEVAFNRVGILADQAANTIIWNNAVHHNDQDGIRISSSSNSDIKWNLIYQNGFGSIDQFVDIGSPLIQSHELEFDFPENGLSVIGGTGMTLSYNGIYSNKGYGLLFTGFGAVVDNDLLQNNVNSSDPLNVTLFCDEGCDQIFAFDATSIISNHYGPLGTAYRDVNGDGIFDDPYQYQCGFELDGSPTLCDTDASVSSVSTLHILTAPTITSFIYVVNPGVAELEVFWTGSIDNQAHDVTYVLQFTLLTHKEKETNTKFFSDPHTGTSLKANVFDFPPGMKYKVQVIASDGEIEAVSEAKIIELGEFDDPDPSPTTSISSDNTSFPRTDDTATISIPDTVSTTTSTSASNLNTTRGRSGLGINLSILAIIVFVPVSRRLKNRK